jgi:two-component system phosphate regulon response regulator PhoB
MGTKAWSKNARREEPGFSCRKGYGLISMIMVVDDDATLLRLMEFVLRPLKCTVVTVENPQEALELLASVTPDLFILDLMMPQINGIDLCRSIRKSPATVHTPVIMLSAHYNQDIVARSLQAGANIYLPKSALHSELLSYVRTFLKRQLPPDEDASRSRGSPTLSY